MLPSRSVVTITVVNENSVKVGRFSGPQWKVEAAILPRIITKLSPSPVSFDTNWRHLSGLCLANPEFGVLGNVDVLLGVDRFFRVVRQGWCQGPPGSPMAKKACFGWVLFGTIRHNGRHRLEELVSHQCL